MSSKGSWEFYFVKEPKSTFRQATKITRAIFVSLNIPGNICNNLNATQTYKKLHSVSLSSAQVYFITFQHSVCVCVRVLSVSLHLLDIQQGEGGWAFGKWLRAMSRWRMAIPVRTDHLGPAASANHTDTSSPPAEMLILSPWGGRKCKLELHFSFSQGFPSVRPFSQNTKTRRLICGDILSRDVEENYWNKIQVWCFYARRWCSHKPSALQCNLCDWL